MDSALAIGLLLLLALAVAIGAVALRNRNRQRSVALREHFGPEYERVLESHGKKSRAERELELRQRRIEKLNIQRLSPQQCERYAASWAQVQQLFVDDPSRSVGEADRLVKDVMSARGYPMGDFEQRVADLSVEHANVIHHYRAARAIAIANHEGKAGTEDLRQAMMHYRALFSDLLQPQAQYAAPLREARV